MRFVNAYHVTREYGGPEEGGWWYDSREVLESVPIPDRGEKEADRIADHLSVVYAHKNDPQPLSNVHSGGKLLVVIERKPGQDTERPHYE
jgi:hypothetical protein